MKRFILFSGRFAALTLVLLWVTWGSTQPAVPANMVLVRGGTFDMGDTFGDGDSEEKPVHRVTVGDFYLAKTELTVKEWRAFASDTGRSMPEAPSWGWHDDHPVVNVSWYDAVEYCNWRSKKEGLTPVYSIKDTNNGTNVSANWSANGYRLPTEAEWEYAARSGGKSEKWAGTSSEGGLGDFAWYGDNSGGQTHPVGQKRSNGLGLFDMTGNVSESVWDWYEDYPNGGQNNPRSIDVGTDHALRGGSWADDARSARSASRSRAPLYHWDNGDGFRVSRSFAAAR